MRWVPLLTLCGCTAAFGLDELPPPATIHGTLVRRYVNLDASEKPQFEQVPFAASEMPLTVLHADGSPIDVTWSADGSFSFDVLRGELYRVLVENGDEYQTTMPAIALAETHLGHPNSQAPDASATIQVNTTDVLRGTPVVQTTGVWYQANPAMPGAAMTLSNAYPQASQAPALPRAAAHDQEHLLVYTSGILVQAGTASADIATSGTTPVNVTMTDAPQYCATFGLQHTRDAERLAMAFPNATTDPSYVTIDATAMPEAGLRAAVIVGRQQTADTGAVDVMYGAPAVFASYTMFSVSATSMHRGLADVNLQAAVDHYQTFAPTTMSSPCVRFDDPDDTVVAAAPRLAHVKLSDDIAVGVDPAQPAELTWDVLGTAPVTYDVILARLDSGTRVGVHTWVVTSPKVLVDPAILDNGSRYLFAILAHGGRDVASGDLRDLHYPFTGSYVETPPFTISK